MFTVQQIKAAHSKVKTGADFPRYVQEIKAFGLIKYDYMVADGRTIYHGADGFQVEAPPIYLLKKINIVPSVEGMERDIKNHQQGRSDFLTICQQAADNGVHRWEVNTQTMMCSYYDITGNRMIAEPIPQGDY